jgi:hypothetical protein
LCRHESKKFLDDVGQFVFSTQDHIVGANLSGIGQGLEEKKVAVKSQKKLFGEVSLPQKPIFGPGTRSLFESPEIF